MRVTRFVDLSVPVDAETVVYPGDPAVRVEPAATIERDGFNVLDLHLGSQTGTHVDAPFHFRPDGARIDELDLSLFAGPAVVVDASGLGPRDQITWEHVRPVADRLTPGMLVLLRTDWSRHYGTPRYFAHPFLAPDACDRLLQAGIRSFFIDALSVDETPDADHPGDGYPCHHLISAAGGIIGENLRCLDQVTWPRPHLSAYPLRLTGADGAPVRAVATAYE